MNRINKLYPLGIGSILLIVGSQLGVGSALAGTRESTDRCSSNSQLQQEIEQELVGCYVVGADLVGAGEIDAAKAVLRDCFADNLRTETVMPPAYQQLSLNTQGGGSAWVDASHAFYQALGVVRTQHILSNVTAVRTSSDTVRSTSSALAIHVFPDEHTLNATVKFDDVFRRDADGWKLEHRIMTVTSLTESSAWSF